MGTKIRYHALGPMMSGEGSRAFLGLGVSDDGIRPVVLIWAPEHVIADAELRERLRRETERAAALDHPNIIRVHGLASIDEGEGLARVVEYADAETARRLLEVAGKLPVEQAAYIVCEVAAGIHYAHMAANEDGVPWIHADIRPETVMVTYAGGCKIAGYGALTVAPKEMGGLRVVGRRKHCSPEQVLGGRDAADKGTDIYLLGLLLYECLTGTIPFTDEEDFDAAVLTKPLPLLDSEAIPEGLRPIIQRATAKKATDRYASAQEFREAIVAVVGTPPTHESFAAFLAETFKDQTEREARKRVLDNGMADLGGKGTAPTPKAESKPEPKPPAPKPAPAAKSEAPRSATTATLPAGAPQRSPSGSYLAPGMPARRSPGPDFEPAIPGRKWPSAIWLAVVVLAGAVAWLAWEMRGARRAFEQPKPTGSTVPVALAVVPDASVAVAAVGTADAGAPSAAPVDSGPSDAGAAAAAGGGKPSQGAGAGQAEPGAEAAGFLDLETSPVVNVSIDGKPAGRSPVRMSLAPGRHTLLLTDSKYGIRLTKTLVTGKGTTRKEIVIGKGSVSVTGPDGSVVEIDGHTVGRLPVIKEIPLHEGKHHIQVRMSGSRWEQEFELEDGGSMQFQVGLQGGE